MKVRRQGARPAPRPTHTCRQGRLRRAPPHRGRLRGSVQPAPHETLARREHRGRVGRCQPELGQSRVHPDYDGAKVDDYDGTKVDADTQAALSAEISHAETVSHQPPQKRQGGRRRRRGCRTLPSRPARLGERTPTLHAEPTGNVDRRRRRAHLEEEGPTKRSQQVSAHCPTARRIRDMGHSAKRTS